MTRLRPAPEPSAFTPLRFLNGEDTLTLWPERTITEEGITWHIGWCPELRNTMFVRGENVVEA
jgi:hypothetical protein